MRVEVLVATMNQTDFSLVEKMNIRTDAIIGNQCGCDKIDRMTKEGREIVYLSFKEKGVGLNRNNALMRASGDICVFADDDIVYFDDYEDMLLRAFEQTPEADVIVFNVKEENSSRFVIKKKHRVYYHNFLRYGTLRVAVRLKSVRENNIYFNQCFGGGTEHCHGEDSIFLRDCLRRGLKIYAVPITPLEFAENRPSTWFKGYDDKYIADQGALYRVMFLKTYRFWCLQDALRLRGRYKSAGGVFKVYKKMIQGAKALTKKSV